jgi:hypothetical protein
MQEFSIFINSIHSQLVKPLPDYVCKDFLYTYILLIIWSEAARFANPLEPLEAYISYLATIEDGILA